MPTAEQTQSDRELVALSQLESHAFELIFERYWSRIFRFCYLRTGDWHTAEDMASQTFLNAFAALSQFKGETDSSFRCWLFTIARNAVTEMHRKRFRQPTEPLAEAEQLASSERALDDDAIAQEQFDHLLRLMSELPADQREMLEMRAAGLNSTEIARILGKSSAAVRQAQWRTIQSLRYEFSEEDAREGVPL